MEGRERRLFLCLITGHCFFWAAYTLHPPLSPLCPLGLSGKPVTPFSTQGLILILTSF